jgi:hypothetical protein
MSTELDLALPPLLSYLDSDLYEPLPPKKLYELSEDIGGQYETAEQYELVQRACSDEERLVLESLLRYIDYCLPNQPGFPRGKRATRITRISTAMGMDVLGQNFATLDTDDMQQHARLATLLQLRKFDSKKGTNPLAPIAYAIVNSIRSNAGKAATGGISYSQEGKKPTTKSERGISRLRDEMFVSSAEEGWSDRLHELHQHSEFCTTEPLRFEPDELKEDYGEDSLLKATRPLVPVAEADFATEFGVPDEVERTSTLDRFFTTMERTPVTFTLLEKRVLRMRFEQEMTFEKIGQALDTTPQAPFHTMANAIKKVRAYPEALRDLQELAPF